LLLRGSGLVSLLTDAKVLAVVSTGALRPVLDEVRGAVTTVGNDRWILTDAPGTHGYTDYATLVAAASDAPTAAAIDRDDRYNIIYSSGTTGSPKGIVHTHAIRAAYCTTFAAAFRMRPESIVMHAGSLIFNGVFSRSAVRPPQAL